MGGSPSGNMYRVTISLFQPLPALISSNRATSNRYCAPACVAPQRRYNSAIDTTAPATVSLNRKTGVMMSPCEGGNPSYEPS
jgi:hypothetical protein